MDYQHDRHSVRLLRKFADSWNGSGEAENAPLLTKQMVNTLKVQPFLP